jgi:hypothetical protein
MDTKAIIVGGNVQGNISNCTIDNQTIKLERNGLWAFSQKETRASYNVCTKEIISQYTIPTFTGFGILTIVCVPVIVIMVLAAIISGNN